MNQHDQSQVPPERRRCADDIQATFGANRLRLELTGKAELKAMLRM